MLRVRVIPRWGRVTLASLALELPLGARALKVRATVGDEEVATTLRQGGTRLEIRLADTLVLTPERAFAAEATL